MFLAAAPARADEPFQNFGKSEAIIGAPSALAAIMAQQHVSVAASVNLRPADPDPLNSGYRSETENLGAEGTRQVQPAIAPAVFSDKPDLFGTVALRVRHTPLDDKWNHVEHARVSGGAAVYAAGLRSFDQRTRLEAINAFVNRRVRFTDDRQEYGRSDVWSTANSTLRRGRGDCEDYAIAKIQMARAAGFSDRDIYLVVLRDLVRRADHAVAVVRSEGQMYVLDDGTDRLLESEAVSDYRPILTFSAYGTWTHGYRISRPVQVASAANSPVTATAAAVSANQRSLSASLLAFNTGFSR